MPGRSCRSASGMSARSIWSQAAPNFSPIGPRSAPRLMQYRIFTRGIRRDQAVVNGLTMAHSSGTVEGNLCRFKALKGQMFGRANLDLLRKRILLSR